MNQNEFGAKVRQLREEKGLTREAFCEDEIELTVRQLTRIEAGNSKPTLTKMQFIANRLGMSLSKLMPDHIELPIEYQNLKYSILRTPTYGQEDLLAKKEQKLTKIYESFYDDLPGEEKFVIDVLQSMADVYIEQDAQFGKYILDDYFGQVAKKEVYTINDLIILQLYFYTLGDVANVHEFNAGDFDHIIGTLLEMTKDFNLDALFILRDVLLLAVNIGRRFHHTVWSVAIFNALNDIMMQFHDFQKKPILNMLMWQYYLFVEKDYQRAEGFFKEAMTFAGMTKQDYLAEKLDSQWKEDNK